MVFGGVYFDQYTSDFDKKIHGKHLTFDRI